MSCSSWHFVCYHASGGSSSFWLLLITDMILLLKCSMLCFAAPDLAWPDLAASARPGTLAGSTVLLLSLAWGCSVLLGRCDLSPVTGQAIDKRLTRGWDLQHTGVTVDNDVS